MPKAQDVTKAEFDGNLFARNMTEMMQEWQALAAEMAQRPASEEILSGEKDVLHISQAFAEMMTNLASDPARIVDLQYGLLQRSLDVWEHAWGRFLGQEPALATTATPIDKRFKDPAWSENIWFDFLKTSYLSSSRWLEEVAREAAKLDPRTAKKVDFYTRQFIDAMSPSNFLLTNPEALKATLDTHGENLIKGFRHLRRDLLAGHRRPQIRMSDETAFALGENIAVSKGRVVFRNDLIELIQYEATTPKVHRIPLLLIPAWINKFYIFDMQQTNSFVRWLADRGFTVFVVSWVNPDKSHSEKNFEHYMLEGPLAALDAIEEITGEKQTAVIGYCLGGTLLSITLAWLAAHKQSSRVASATYLTTMIDFSEPGELGVFIDEEQIALMEERMSARGYLEGSEMAATFNMLRANDLIWSFVVNNYLLGKEPFPFDLLYWNADSTRMPARMHSFYLRNMYHKNLLRKSGGLKFGGVAVDLRKIKTPTYILSTREDHIAPWRSTFASTGIYGGDITFTLAASGHIAGVINHPGKEKYNYWTSHLKPEATPESWFAGAREHKGSWWPHWKAWQAKLSGPKVKARIVEDYGLGDAPGSYVRVR